MIRKSLLVLGLIFLGMQFVRPAKNTPVAGSRDHDLFSQHTAPAEVKAAFQRACYDCHSNETRYPWYAEVQPAGWFLASHVRDGKKHLNFSEFGKQPHGRARRQLEACLDEITEGTMPLASYTWIHRHARLTDAEIEAVAAWVEKTGDHLRQLDVAGEKSPTLSVSGE
jgi:mono/diheme cytochrome c family protein